jgi:hypothetical protein
MRRRHSGEEGGLAGRRGDEGGEGDGDGGCGGAYTRLVATALIP